jgi:multidrug resistance efflux pump
MLPPQVQAADEEEGAQMPPQVMAILQQAQQEIQQLQAALQEAQSGMATKQLEVQAKLQQTAMVEQSKQQLAQAQIESAERIAALNADVKRDMSELAGAIQLMAKKLEVPLSLGQEVEADLAESEPVEEKPDPMMLLAEAISAINKPKRKRITAPSGGVYSVEDVADDPQVML